MGAGMTARPHILLINVYYAPHSYGGATRVCEAVSRSLMAEHGVRVSVISAMCRPEVAPYAVLKCQSQGIDNYMINMPPGRSYEEMYRNPRVSARIRALAEDLEPDLAHLHCLQEIGADAIGSLKEMGLPVVLSVHDFWWLCERQFMLRPDSRYCGQDPVRIDACKGCVGDMEKARARFAFLRDEAAKADLVTFPSRFALDLSRRSGLGGKKGVVWENGVQLPGPEFFAAQTARRRSDGRLSFGFVGGPSPLKGWPIILEAFKRIGRSDFTGYLVDGSLDGSWWQNQDISGMKGEWHIHPRYDSRTIDDFYARIDVLLFLSQWKETFGLTVREALARGIRVIQTDSGGTTEHEGPDRHRMLPIGAGPEKLLPVLEELLDAPREHPEPVPVISFSQQAGTFMRLIRPLLEQAEERP